MSTFTFTPGPWCTDGTNIYATNADGKRRYIAYTAQSGEEKNAQLIAFAPHLVTTLRNLIGFIEYHELEKENPRLRLHLADARNVLNTLATKE